MIISLKWISDFVDVSDYLTKPDELADVLTAAGLEVEGVDDPSKDFKNVVIGHIIEKGQHPDADRLTLCQVDVGDGKLRQIVCGAKNHSKGDKVVVALPGAVLPGNFEIKLSKIRGVESQGMLSSESELGLKKESEGILLLPKDAPVGKPFAEYQGLNDITLEINVTPNRADCLSHYGLAREIAALLDRPLKAVDAKPAVKKSLFVKEKVKLSVPESDLCPRYMGIFVEGVKVGETPVWIKQRLESVGMNSINNVVDITNYVMMELGQPLHAFDADQIKGREVIVKRSKPQEKFITLDGSEITLTGDELTIRDAESAMCVAGVIGGKNSGVSDSTKNIFLESAHFTMESVRKTSRKHGLQTDSAYRFSRGTDISMVETALKRAAQLLTEVCGGQASEDHYDIYPKAKPQGQITVAYSYVSDRLGYPVDAQEFNAWMKRLGCTPVKTDATQGTFSVPSHRVDLEQDVDLVEEYGRFKGYDSIPEILPVLASEPLAHDLQAILKDSVTDAVIDLGYSQAVNYGFVSGKHQEQLFGDGEVFRKARLNFPKNSVKLKNPLSEELNTMRVSLVPGLITNLFYNFRYGNKVGRLFEVGSRFSKAEDGKYQEDVMAAFMAWGQTPNLWQAESKVPLFYEVKSTLEKLFARFQMGGPKGLLAETVFGSLEFRAWEGEVPKFLHPGQTATVFCEGKVIGYIGTLHPNILAEEKIKVPAVVAEIELSAFERALSRPIKAKTPSKYQSVERDLSFMAPKELSAGAVIQVIKKVAGNYLQSVTVTDEFTGGNLEASQKSFAFRMVLQDENGTLQDKQLLELQNQMIEQAEKKLGVKLR